MNNNQIFCNLCEGKNFDSIPNRVFGNKLLRCRNCGLVFIYPRFPLEDLKKFYNKSYFKNNNSHLYGYQDYLKDKPNIIKTSKKRIAKIQKLYPQKGKILDLGCAVGFFLEVTQEDGWESYGVEISDYASNIAKKAIGTKIYQGPFLGQDFPEKYFDVITAWDYIEHTLDPKAELAKISYLLKDDGLFVFCTPDIESLPAKIAKGKWMGFKDIEHLYYFSGRTIQRLIRESGLEIIKKEYIGKHINLELFFKRLSLYNNALANMLKNLVPKRFCKKSLYINPLDIMCIYTRKKS